jgi:type IX secretion system PorP/SprF family membrane protein
MERYGYGAYIQMDRAGSSGYSTMNFMVSGAYEIMNADYRRRHQLTVGLQMGVVQRTFDPSGHVFDSQYVGGDQGFDTGLHSGENFVRTSLLGFDANMGVSYVNMDEKIRARPFGGIMFAHLSRPRQSFTDELDRSPMRMAFHGGAEVDAAEKLTLTPSVLYMSQSGARLLSMNLLGGYALDGDYTLLLGGGYRNKDAVVIQTGVRYRTTTMRIGYDRNISSLKSYTGGMGGWEISLVHGGMFKGR